jgi:regulatory protein
MPKVITFHTAVEKARKYCVYQERSQQEVRNKLFSFGLQNNEVEEGIVVLIEEGFINEERFAIAYARGRFRIKNWGKVKIKAGLKAKMISQYCIKRALELIDEDEYFETMRKVLINRARNVKETNPLKRNFLLAKYAVSQGFEPEFVWDMINENSF